MNSGANFTSHVCACVKDFMYKIQRAFVDKNMLCNYILHTFLLSTLCLFSNLANAEILPLGKYNFSDSNNHDISVRIKGEGYIELDVKQNDVLISKKWQEDFTRRYKEKSITDGSGYFFSEFVSVTLIDNENIFEFSGFAEYEYVIAVIEDGKPSCLTRVTQNFKFQCKFSPHFAPTYRVYEENLTFDSIMMAHTPEQQQDIIEKYFVNPNSVRSAAAIPNYDIGLVRQGGIQYKSDKSYFYDRKSKKYHVNTTHKIQIAPLENLSRHQLKENKNANLYMLINMNNGNVLPFTSPEKFTFFEKLLGLIGFNKRKKTSSNVSGLLILQTENEMKLLDEFNHIRTLSVLNHRNRGKKVLKQKDWSELKLLKGDQAK